MRKCNKARKKRVGREKVARGAGKEENDREMKMKAEKGGNKKKNGVGKLDKTEEKVSDIFVV